MRVIKKSDSPTFYRLLQYGTCGNVRGIKDSCQKNSAILLGITFMCLISVVCSFLIYWGCVFIFAAPLTIITGMFFDYTDYSILLWVLSILTIICYGLISLFISLKNKWKEIYEKLPKKEKEVKTKNFTYQVKKSYKSFKEKYCELITVVDE